MTVAYDEAVDDIHRVFKATWDLIDLAPPYRVFYEGVGAFNPPAGDVNWARFTVRHLPSVVPPTLSAPTKVYTRNGIVTVQIFAVSSAGQGKVQAGLLAKAVRNALEGVRSPLGVALRNANILEIGEDKTWYNINVTAEFEYHEVR